MQCSDVNYLSDPQRGTFHSENVGGYTPLMPPGVYFVPRLGDKSMIINKMDNIPVVE
jgi:hypothetical protein